MHIFENEDDTKNREIIKDIVKKYFSLDDESQNRFEKALDEPFASDIFAGYLDNSLRYRKELSLDELKEFDPSWRMFRRTFPDFITDKKVSYENYLNGKITINKNEVKLLKAIYMYYLDDLEKMYDFYIKNIDGSLNRSNFFNAYEKLPLERKQDLLEGQFFDIVKTKLPKLKKYYLVITVNFADYFLSATGDGWNSCLSLTSHWDGVYWAGLPGLAVDKNRFMLYITSGEKKNYKGIITDKMYFRSFGLIDKNNNLRYVKWYPSQIIINKEIGFTNFPKIYPMNDGFVRSKFDINLLTYKNGLSCYIFQDNTSFEIYSKNSVYLIYDEKGMRTIRPDGEIHFGTIFNLRRSHGLDTLMVRKKEIVHYDNERMLTYCNSCEIEIEDESDIYYVDGVPYCRSCYEENFFTCEECGELVHTNFLVMSDDNREICERCFYNSRDEEEEDDVDEDYFDENESEDGDVMYEAIPTLFWRHNTNATSTSTSTDNGWRISINVSIPEIVENED